MARADRLILSPEGNALPPQGGKMEFALSADRSEQNLSWLQFATYEGVELEIERAALNSGAKARYALDVQYPLTSDLGNIPAISVGVRDLFGTGLENHSLYLAASRTLPLSDRQLRLLREVRLNVGVGTDRMDGLFAGVQMRLVSGISLYAEYYRQRPNFAIGLTLARGLQAKVYSLDGTIQYGLMFRWSH
jgi:hypothetical protein